MKKAFTQWARFLVMVSFAFAFVGCAATATKESTGEYLDDTVISTKVRAAIVADPVLKLTEINVETFKGIVQLSGFVADANSIQKATEVTMSVKGVKSVKNDIRLK